MTETLRRSTGRRGGREARLLTAGVLVCGAVLLPAASASADHVMMNGMLCPHAVGDASNPATSAPPTRTAPNEAPLGAKPSSVVTQPSPGRAATKPASNPPAQRAAATQPASTTASAKSGAGAVAKVTQPKRAMTPVAQPQRAASPVAQPKTVATPVAQRSPVTTSAAKSPARARPQHSAPARSAQVPRAITTVIPEVTRPSAGSAPRVTSTSVGTKPGGVGWLAIGGALALIACAALLVVLRRRGDGDAEVAPSTSGPLEPVRRAGPTTFDEVEIALQELLAEARARELLGGAEGNTDAVEAVSS